MQFLQKMIVWMGVYDQRSKGKITKSISDLPGKSYPIKTYFRKSFRKDKQTFDLCYIKKSLIYFIKKTNI